MPKITQTESGKAWEYGLARNFADVLNSTANLMVNASRNKSQESYDLLGNQDRGRIDWAANEAVVFLRAHDPRLLEAKHVVMQGDMTRSAGDVRDILVHMPDGIIGISAKHRHKGLKHSRLSATIDFGAEWYGRECSAEYWNAVLPVFGNLADKRGGLWRDLPDKSREVYMPILDAFMREVKTHADTGKMMRYLLGRHDFYKIVKENGHISMQSFNMDGGLRWGKKIPMPSRIVEASMKPNSRTTALLTMDHGWQLSFRIHSATAEIEPSLKFDVQLIGNPQQLSSHEIPLS